MCKNLTLAALISTASMTTMAHAQVATTQSDPAAAEPAAEDIIVTGMRQSMQSSAQIKKNTMEVVDSITAEDIGKLPDPNVAETLTRIPGVQGYRFGGEAASPVGTGSGLTVRGLSGQTASRIDGRAYFTAGQREFNIEGAIPGMIAGIDVYKNPSAEHIEGGIGGLINIRTRRPLDLKQFTLSAAVTGRYNDLAQQIQPEVFGLVANRWDVGDGELGVLIAGNYQKSFNRSDNNPANGGTSIRRAIRADSAEYAGNASLDRSLVGRSDVWYLADVADPLALTPAQRSDLISTVTQVANIFQEDIRRTRLGLNGVLQWKPNPDLEFYAEGNYNYYQYFQQYRFLFTGDSRYVRNLTTSAFDLTEDLAIRNRDGGGAELLSGRILDSGTFLNSSLSTTGGDEHRTYKTWIAATGFKWAVTDNFDVDLDLSYVKADQRQDNRSAGLASRTGLAWDITRDLTTQPHAISISGPDLASPGTWVFNNYSNGTNQVWDDEGLAAQLDLTYRMDGSFLTAIKAGLRYARQTDSYRNFSFSGKNLTTDGLALAADRSNAIPVTANPDLVSASPTNWMAGKAGYSGGYLVFSPEALLGDNVRNRFPLAGIAAEDSLPEILLQRRYFEEQTYAGYVVGEFAFLGDRIKGNAGVRVVKTDVFARAQITNNPGGGAPVTIIPNEVSNSYTDVLPSFNVTGYITPDTLVRFGYGKGITRPDVGALNPAIVVNDTTGTGSVGNPDLRPQKADSYDLSLEHYFSRGNYVSLGLFYKKIDGFFSGVEECVTVPTAPPYSGVNPNNCGTGQYRITRQVNAEQGSAKGVEVAVQTFFDYDFVPKFLQNFGVAGSYTFVKTENPVLIGGQIVQTRQPFTSDHSWSLAGMYEDSFLSARLVYTWRSDFVLFGVASNPIDGRYVGASGTLDASVNFKLPHNFTLSLTASNITNQGADRFVGEPGANALPYERQHFVNGRIFGATLRYSLGN